MDPEKGHAFNVNLLRPVRELYDFSFIFFYDEREGKCYILEVWIVAEF